MKRWIIAIVAVAALASVTTTPAQAAVPRGQVTVTTQQQRGTISLNDTGGGCWWYSWRINYKVIFTVAWYQLKGTWCGTGIGGHITSYSYQTTGWACCTWIYDGTIGSGLYGGINQTYVGKWTQGKIEQYPGLLYDYPYIDLRLYGSGSTYVQWSA